MIAAASQWWLARSARERLLLRAAGAAILIAILLMGYQAAAQYRARAAANLAGAQTVAGNVAQLKQAAMTPEGPALQGADGTTRGLALAAAAASGLTPERIEPAGPDRVRIAFGPAQSLQFYRWIDVINRRGAFVARTHMTRTETDQVKGEFEVAASP